MTNIPLDDYSSALRKKIVDAGTGFFDFDDKDPDERAFDVEQLYKNNGVPLRGGLYYVPRPDLLPRIDMALPINQLHFCNQTQRTNANHPLARQVSELTNCLIMVPGNGFLAVSRRIPANYNTFSALHKAAWDAEYASRIFEIESLYNDQISTAEHLHNEQLSACIDCGFITDCRQEILRHRKVHIADQVNRHTRAREFTCPECDKAFSTISNAQRHIREKHFNVHGRCCGFDFDTRADYDDHRRRFHSTASTARPNNTDSRTSRRRKKRASKIDTNGAIDGLHCNLCNKDYASERGALQHWRNCHNSTPRSSTIHKCRHCPFETNRLYVLRGHEAKHGTPTESHPFPCDVCPSQFTAYEDLVAHVKHAHRRKFRCSTCNVRFYTLAEFYTHKYAVHRKVSPAMQQSTTAAERDADRKRKKDELQQSVVIKRRCLRERMAENAHKLRALSDLVGHVPGEETVDGLGFHGREKHDISELMNGVACERDARHEAADRRCGAMVNSRGRLAQYNYPNRALRLDPSNYRSKDDELRIKKNRRLNTRPIRKFNPLEE